MKIINVSRNTLLADKAVIAGTFFSRLTGLLGRSGLKQGEALILAPSNAIHSFFMRFTFDAVFLNRKKQVIGLVPWFKPFRLSRVYFSAVYTIELPSGIIQSSNTQIKDQIEF